MNTPSQMLRRTGCPAAPEAAGRRLRRADPLMAALLAALLAFLFAPQLVLFASSPLMPLRGRIEVGTVRPGEHVRREFLVANLSTRAVRVLSVTGGCGCVASLIGEPRIPPFATKTIQASFVAKGRPGPLHRAVILETDDARRPYLALKLEGTLAATARAGTGTSRALPPPVNDRRGSDGSPGV